MPDRGEQFQVKCVLATDWAYYESTLPRHHDFDSMDAMIVGFVLEEDDENIVLAHQVFEGGKIVRHVTVIPKKNIKEEFGMVIQTQEQGE